MSNRALRDYLRQKELEEAQGQAREGEAPQRQKQEDKEKEDEGQSTKQQECRMRVKNVFDMLDDDGGGDGEGGEEKEEDEEDEEVMPKAAPRRAKKKSKSKNKNKNKRKKDKQSDDDKDDDDAVLEAAIKDKQEQAAAAAAASSPATPPKDKSANRAKPSIFTVQSRFFDPDQEMREFFGQQALEASGLSADTERWPPNSVVRGKAEWARSSAGSGLSMKQLDGRRFAFDWSARYAATQRAHEAAVRLMDVGAMMELLNEDPWHADTLFQVALLRLHTGEKEAAEDMLVRCLYAQQRAFHHMFSTRGDCRLLYADHAQNRTFLMALFRYAAVLNERGCVRAALELTKFLYTLDPSDPLGALLVVDHYAVKAAQYDVLDAVAAIPALGGAGDALRPLELPNMRFSAALAQHRREAAAGDSAHARSGAMLEHALAIYPLVGRLLLAKDDKSEQCQQLLHTALFGEAAAAETPEALAHIIAIFVERNNDLWHEADVHAWFLKHCAAAAAAADASEHQEKQEQQQQQEQQEQIKAAQKLAEERTELYKRCMASEVLKGVYRHLLVSDFSTAVAQIPRDVLMDVLRADGGGLQAVDDAERPPPVVPAPTGNVLRLLIYTLLPWVPVPNAPPRQ